MTAHDPAAALRAELLDTAEHCATVCGDFADDAIAQRARLAALLARAAATLRMAAAAWPVTPPPPGPMMRNRDAAERPASAERDLNMANERLAKNIAAGRSPLDEDMLRTIRSYAYGGFSVPTPRVVQLVDELRAARTAAEGSTSTAADRPDLDAARAKLHALAPLPWYAAHGLVQSSDRANLFIVDHDQVRSGATRIAELLVQLVNVTPAPDDSGAADVYAAARAVVRDYAQGSHGDAYRVAALRAALDRLAAAHGLTDTEDGDRG